jgi:hypothetical protein
MQQSVPLSRRFSSRIEAPWDVCVCWGSDGYDDTSLLRDLSSRGMFVLTHKSKSIGVKASLYFLVEEGHIRVEGVVRQLKAAVEWGCNLHPCERRIAVVSRF